MIIQKQSKLGTGCINLHQRQSLTLHGVCVLAVFLFIKSANADNTIDLSIIAEIESNNSSQAISYRGINYGTGLYQISSVALKDFNKVNHTEIKQYDLFNPSTNDMVAKFMFKKRIPQILRSKRIEENIDNILTAYNCGYKRTCFTNPPLETKEYLKKYHNRKAIYDLTPQRRTP